MTAALAIAASGILALVAASGAAAEICWSKPQLRHTQGEEHVRRNVPDALVPPPRTSARPVSQSPYAWRGVLRRVDLPPGQKVIALTFDLCEQPSEIAGYQGGIVDFLRENAIKATFFAGGKWLMTHEARAQQFVADPLFEIANHAWEHRNLRLLSGSALDDEIWNVQQAHRATQQEVQRKACLPASRTGAMTLFRFPFGACNARAIEAVEAAGLRAVQWDVSSGDPSRSMTAERMAGHVLSHVKPGSIVLFHANGRGYQTEKALPLIVARLREQGYRFATVSEMLRIKGAQPVTTDTCYDSRPGDTDRYDSLARMLAIQHAQEVAQLRSGRPTPVRAGTADPAPAPAETRPARSDAAAAPPTLPPQAVAPTIRRQVATPEPPSPMPVQRPPAEPEIAPVVPPEPRRATRPPPRQEFDSSEHKPF